MHAQQRLTGRRRNQRLVETHQVVDHLQPEVSCAGLVLFIEERSTMQVGPVDVGRSCFHQIKVTVGSEKSDYGFIRNLNIGFRTDVGDKQLDVLQVLAAILAKEIQQSRHDIGEL